MTTREGTYTSPLQRHVPGCYRVAIGTRYYAQFKHAPHGWHAEIYRSNGDLYRYADLHPTRADAMRTVASIARIQGLGL